jgi:vacuolar-type H+-ATPase subunit H
MAKKNIEDAIKDAHESADKAIDEAQADLTEARQDLVTWLNEEYTYKRSKLIAFGSAVALVIAALILL